MHAAWLLRPCCLAPLHPPISARAPSVWLRQAVTLSINGGWKDVEIRSSEDEKAVWLFLIRLLLNQLVGRICRGNQHELAFGNLHRTVSLFACAIQANVVPQLLVHLLRLLQQINPGSGLEGLHSKQVVHIPVLAD